MLKGNSGHWLCIQRRQCLLQAVMTEVSGIQVPIDPIHLWLLSLIWYQEDWLFGQWIQFSRLWSMSDMTLLARTDLDQKARSLGFSADGSHLAVGLGDGSFMVLKARYTVNKIDNVCLELTMLYTIWNTETRSMSLPHVVLFYRLNILKIIFHWKLGIWTSDFPGINLHFFLCFLSHSKYDEKSAV